MNPLDMLPLPYRIAIVAFVLAVATVGAVAFVHHHDAAKIKEGRDQVTALWNADKAKQSAQALADAQTNARETLRRMERQKEAQDEFDAQLAAAQRDAAAATAALDGLRRRANQYAAAARRAASHPAAVTDGAPAADPSGVLADVLGKLGGRAQLLAAYADAARRAGKQCERDYDALSATVH